MDGKFGEQQIIKWLRSMMNKLGEIFWKIFGKLAFLYFFRNIFFLQPQGNAKFGCRK